MIYFFSSFPWHQLEVLRLQLQSDLYANIESEQNPPGHPDSVFAKINSRKQRHDLRLMSVETSLGRFGGKFVSFVI